MSSKEIPLKISSTFQYLQIFNGIFQLTDMEMHVLSVFIDNYKKLQQAGVEINPFSTDAKKQVARELGKDDFNTLNNYIKALHDKGAISRVEEGYRFHRFILPEHEDKVIFKLLWQK